MKIFSEFFKKHIWGMGGGGASGYIIYKGRDARRKIVIAPEMVPIISGCVLSLPQSGSNVLLLYNHKITIRVK